MNLWRDLLVVRKYFKREMQGMIKRYVMAGVLIVMVAGCTSKDTIPPMPPKSETTQVEEVRTVAQLESKLDRIRTNIEGEDISRQKRDARHEIDTLLGDAKQYKRKISRFEKAQLLAYKKAKISYRHKLKRSGKKVHKPLVVNKQKKETINMVNEYENKLKYY